MKMCQVRPLCNDKNCQSPKSMCYDKKCQVKSEGTQSSSLWSVPKTAYKQIGTELEITRNIISISQVRAVIHLKVHQCLQFQEITRYNLSIVIPEVPRCNLQS